MRALVCPELGPVDGLELREVADPEPGQGEVVIDVSVAALNFPDTLIIEGRYQFRPDPPFTPGGEAAGVISAVGPGVDLAVGTRVAAMGTEGAFAEKWVVPAALILPVPDGMAIEQAAGFTMTYGTSYYALKQRAGLFEGETLLVLGAAGGVGSAAVELGRAMGATVIAAASTDEKLRFATGLGAHHTINYADGDLRAAVKEITDGAGADVVYDPVGGDLAEPAFRSIAWNGRYLVVGFAAGNIPALPLNLPLLKGASIVGVFWGQWMMTRPAEAAPNVRELYEMAAAGTIAPRISAVHDLADYRNAFADITSRAAMGKVLLRVAPG
ncbi:MAG: NADPH:quinone oxidoreductase family protein [Acidimicrobiia bacterium]|nr:NADPH:quinone oxidoreductase family protein [Acidimicrobiia bacterium]